MLFTLRMHTNQDFMETAFSLNKGRFQPVYLPVFGFKYAPYILNQQQQLFQTLLYRSINSLFNIYLKNYNSFMDQVLSGLPRR